MKILLTGALGSLAATLVLFSIADEIGAVSPLRFLLGFTVAAMFFTVPGATMLNGLRAILEERTLSANHIDVLIIAAGTLVGAMILACTGDWRIASVGGGYGCATAIALVLPRRISRS